MVKGLKPLIIQNWLGMDQWTDVSELPPNAFSDSSNVVVAPNGNVLPLRSPANYNTALTTGNKVISCAEYDRTAGAVQIFDINNTSGANVRTYVTTGGANTLLRSGQADAAWISHNVNNTLYRVNGTEFIQYVTSFAAYNVGIAAPAAAPTVSITGGGAGSLTTGVFASYAYHNTGTTHVGECSAVSSLSGPSSTGSNTLRVGVVASAESGVDKIVLFVSDDGGTVRYLLIDSSGAVQLFANSTGNIDVSVDNIYRNLNVPESEFNVPPPSGITFISPWKNRIVGAINRQFYYSGYDQITIGVPQECWPPLNFVTIPNRAEFAQGGIETPVGFLGMSDRDSYLLAGTPTDKVDSGENTLQITEQFDPLSWSLGTRSPKTLANTPYGTVWLDQNKRLQLWAWEGQPQPIALGIWEDLADIQDTDAARAMAQAIWFPAAGINGGFYVITGSTTGSTNNRMWIVTLMQTPEGLQIRPCPSSIAAQSIFTAKINGKLRCLIGVTDRLREILDFDLAGAGWASTDRIYFDFVVGNQLTNFNRFHSLELNGIQAQDATLRVSEVDGSNSETVQLFTEHGSYFGLVDRYSTRHRVTIEFPTDDAAKRIVQNARAAMASKGRVI